MSKLLLPKNQTIKCLFGLPLRQKHGASAWTELGHPQFQHALPPPERPAGTYSREKKAELSVSPSG